MKFTLSWLKEHLDTTASVDEISETLTSIGLEVEEVINPASQLADFVTAVMGKKITITNTLKRIKIDGYFSGYKDVRYYNDRVSVFEVTIYVPSGRSIAY